MSSGKKRDDEPDYRTSPSGCFSLFLVVLAVPCALWVYAALRGRLIILESRPACECQQEADDE